VPQSAKAKSVRERLESGIIFGVIGSALESGVSMGSGGHVEIF